MSKKPRDAMNEKCCYCGGDATTRDHVPHRALFPRPRPTDLITVPACESCNNVSSLDEEYFLHVLLSWRDAKGPVIDSLRKQRFESKYLVEQRPPRRLAEMAERMLRSMEQRPLYSPAGLYLGDATTLTVDRNRFDRVLDKIARGLYFHTSNEKERIPAECAAEVIFNPGLETFENPDIKAIITASHGRSVGGQTFEYRIARADEPANAVMCFMVFFGTLPMVVGFFWPRTVTAHEGKPDLTDPESQS